MPWTNRVWIRGPGASGWHHGHRRRTIFGTPHRRWKRMDPTRTTARDIRRRNRSTLLSTLFFQAPLSRLELSQVTGLSAATVSNVTAELVEERLVVEAGLVESDGGRPRVLLRVDPGYGHVIGIDVGETRVPAALFGLAMRWLARVDEPLSTSRPDAAVVADRVAAGIHEVIATAGVT